MQPHDLLVLTESNSLLFLMTTREQKQLPCLHPSVETNPPYRPGADEAKKCRCV